MKLSNFFTLAQLSVTQTGLSNTPTDERTLKNLANLASLLDDVTRKVGPFTVVSAYRSPEVNRRVGGSSTSLHLQGLAADVFPTIQNLPTFYQRLYEIKDSFGELYLKPDQGTVHLTVPLPGLVGRVRILKDGQYRAFNQAEIMEYGLSAPVIAGQTNMWVWGALVLTFGGGVFLWLTGKK